LAHKFGFKRRRSDEMTFELEKKYGLLYAPSIALSVAHTRLPADAPAIAPHWILYQDAKYQMRGAKTQNISQQASDTSERRLCYGAQTGIRARQMCLGQLQASGYAEIQLLAFTSLVECFASLKLFQLRLQWILTKQRFSNYLLWVSRNAC
jgi:hypothetical protein